MEMPQLSDRALKHTSYVALGAAVFLLATLLSNEIAALMSWGQAAEPGFVAKVLGHFGAVGTAWVAGKLRPQPD